MKDNSKKLKAKVKASTFVPVFQPVFISAKCTVHFRLPIMPVMNTYILVILFVPVCLFPKLLKFKTSDEKQHMFFF